MVELSLTCLRWIFRALYSICCLPSTAIAFDLKERRVGSLMKKMCPNNQMNCIGKYRRNLINMDETLKYFYFEKLVFLVELIFMSVSIKWEEAMGPDAIFWIYNSIVFAQSVIQTMLQCIILSCSIEDIDEKGTNEDKLLRFHVSRLVVKTFSKAAADKLKKSSDYFEAILVSSTIYCHFFYFIFFIL